mgnify:CR=1 FL=1
MQALVAFFDDTANEQIRALWQTLQGCGLPSSGRGFAPHITFAAGASGTLKVDAAATQNQSFGNVIAGFTQGDSVDLAGVASSGGTSALMPGL